MTGGAFAAGEPIGPYGLTTGEQTVPEGSRQAKVIGWPKSGLAGLLLVSIGEFVWLLWFHAASPWKVSPVSGRAMSEVSRPLTRKSWPLTLKNTLPTAPGSKKATWTLSQLS